MDDADRSQSSSPSDAAPAHLAPVIEEAFRQGRLVLAALDDIASPAGIPLAGTPEPIVLLLPEKPTRNPKHHIVVETRAGHGHPSVKFEGGEHMAIGDSVLLRFGGEPGIRAGDQKLVLPNGLELTYGQIVALGGDFYGIVGSPISDGRTAQERIDRFTNAFDSLARADVAVDEATKILAVMGEEIERVRAAIGAGGMASAEYAKLADKLSEQWNQITGGGWLVKPWVPPGRYLMLAGENWDHFGQHAVLAYQAGHAAALQQATKAGESEDPRLALMLAYAMNAFADHYLSDLFSSGHLRTPRKELYRNVTPSEVGSLLSRYMHDEDCHWGLIVTNGSKGQRWHAYGDKRYFDAVNFDNMAKVNAALQMSVDEIFQACQTGKEPDPGSYQALALVVPDLKRVQSAFDTAGHISPLFVWDGATVLRRNDINNLDDFSWTADWVGVATLTKLIARSDPPPPASYPPPPATAPSITPDSWQKNSMPPNWVEGARVRYAMSFLAGPDRGDPRYESDLGPWSPYVTVGANQSFPELGNLPVGPPTTIERFIYRQFGTDVPTCIVRIEGNDPGMGWGDFTP
jgi:hypothetical protein